jgi:hypothetical protein
VSRLVFSPVADVEEHEVGVLEMLGQPGRGDDQSVAGRSFSQSGDGRLEGKSERGQESERVGQGNLRNRE